MRYLALATDYDGTLATDGLLDAATIAALERLRESGRRLILVSGRELDDMRRVCDRFDLFERAVLENGALLYNPATHEERALGEPPPEAFVEALRARGVAPLSVGRNIVATWEPHETTVLETIRELGIEWQVIFNKGAVMALPSGVNKASGLRVALAELGLSPHNTVGIGDAENDHAFLDLCECAVAVANALPAVKERADFVTAGARGAGVQELIALLLEDDLAAVTDTLTRYDILIGHNASGGEVMLQPHSASVLVAGPSGSGKSTTTTGLIERLAEKGYQFCLIDPEGDYEDFAGAVTMGDNDEKPKADDVLKLLERPEQNVVVNLLGVKLDDRPHFFASFLPRLQEMRATLGRPHWVIIDEAHHLLPRDWKPANETLPKDLRQMLLITVHPDWVSPAVLDQVTHVIAVGRDPDETLAGFARALDRALPNFGGPVRELQPGEVYVWEQEADAPPYWVKAEQGVSERRRHRRKYASGEIPEQDHFFFTGPEGKLNLRAQNLIIFTQIADGVDDATWEHHLRNGDITRWFRDAIKDDDLADAAQRILDDAGLSPRASRDRIRDEVEKRYTLPA